jgi:hypothetical protein
MNSTLLHDALIRGVTVTDLVSDSTPFCSAVG